MKIKPIGDRVLIEREESEEKTSGGILLPDTAKEKPQIGKVVAVGDGRSCGMASGSLVAEGWRPSLFHLLGRRRIQGFQGGKLLLMREEDILCTLG